MSTEENPNILPGRLICIDYDGLSLRMHEEDYLYVEGAIPPTIWQEVRTKHLDVMKDPDWEVADLHKVTMAVLRSWGLKVQSFRGTETFSVCQELCDWCRCSMPEGDKIVTSDATGDCRFCSESCLLDALLSKSATVKVVYIDALDPGDALLECPHCHKQSRATSDKWSSEGIFNSPHEKFHSLDMHFSIMTCPNCGGVAPLIEPMPANAADLPCHLGVPVKKK